MWVESMINGAWMSTVGMALIAMGASLVVAVVMMALGVGRGRTLRKSGRGADSGPVADSENAVNIVVDDATTDERFEEWNPAMLEQGIALLRRNVDDLERMVEELREEVDRAGLSRHGFAQEIEEPGSEVESAFSHELDDRELKRKAGRA